MRSYGRHVNHDPRSRSFGIATTAQPKTVLWSHKAPVLDQKSVGACTGNALAQWLNTDYATAFRTGKAYLSESNALSLYERATQLDSIPGSYPPDDTGSDAISACKAGVEQGYLQAYRHAFGFSQLLTALQSSPVLAGTDWTSGMEDPHKGVIRTTGDVVGGHEYLIVGANLERKYLTILNSWSDQWGTNGRARISFADYQPLLANQGDITVPVGKVQR